MAAGLFKSRRSTANVDETSKVAEAVFAYYEAGRRPPNYRLPSPPDEVHDVDDFVDAELDDTDLADTAFEDTAFGGAAGPPDQPTAGGKSLSQLAEELESLIEAIRYGDSES